MGRIRNFDTHYNRSQSSSYQRIRNPHGDSLSCDFLKDFNLDSSKVQNQSSPAAEIHGSSTIIDDSQSQFSLITGLAHPLCQDSNSVNRYRDYDHPFVKGITKSYQFSRQEKENKFQISKLFISCIEVCKSRYDNDYPLISILSKKLSLLCRVNLQTKGGIDSSLPRTVFLAFFLSFLFSQCCQGYVLNEHQQELSRVKHSVDHDPSSPFSSSSPTSISSPSSYLPSNHQSLSPPAPPNSTDGSNSKLKDNDTNGISSNDADSGQVSNLASTFISTLQKMHVLPTSNTSICISLEEINPGNSINKPDTSLRSSYFTISLTFKVTNLDDADPKLQNEKDNNTTEDFQNSTSSENASTTQSTTSTTHDCVSDPKVLLALILDENGILVNTMANPERGNNQRRRGHGNSGNSGTTRNPAGLTLEAGNLSRTQVVVIATCSTIIGFFFLSAAFLRIRNYVKRLQFEKANARRKKFRSCSVALRNSGQSSEQLRRDSLNSKASQMNSQSNVSAQEMSTPSSPRREMDTSPYLLVTMAALDPMSQSDSQQGDFTKDFLERDKFTLTPNDISPGNSISSSRQPSPNGDVSQRVSPIPSGLMKNGNAPIRGGSMAGLYRGGSCGSGGGVNMSTSSSSPKIYTGGAPTHHPQLAKVRGVGLVRASSLGNSRDAKVAHLPQRGSLKLLRNTNRVAGKDLPPPPVPNGRCVFANAFVKGGGNYIVPKNGTYDNGRVPLESMKSVSFDVNSDYQTGSGSCLTCDAISKKLDMICHNLKDSNHSFPMSSIHQYHQNSSVGSDGGSSSWGGGGKGGGGGSREGGGGVGMAIRPNNMSVDNTTLNNAGAALSFPSLGNKDVNRNIQPLVEGSQHYHNNVYPSSTSSSPGESSQRGLTNSERLSTSFPNSRQDLRSTEDLQNSSTQCLNEFQTGCRENQHISNSSQYYPSSSDCPQMNGAISSCGNLTTNKNMTENENKVSHPDHNASKHLNNNCDITEQTVLNVDSSSREIDSFSAVDSQMQPYDIDKSPEDVPTYSDSANTNYVQIKSTMQDKNAEPSSKACDRRLTKSNENVHSLNKPDQTVNGSLPCILLQKANNEDIRQQKPTAHKANNSPPAENGNDFLDVNDSEYSVGFPLCGSTNAHKLALFPNRRRTLNRKSDKELAEHSDETTPDSESSVTSNHSPEEELEEIIIDTSFSDSSRDLTSPKANCGEREKLLEEYSHQEMTSPEYYSHSVSNDSYESLSPISPQPTSSSPFLQPSASVEYIL